MSRTFAIGDIHGCNRTFQKLITQKLNITKSDVLYCLGDYIDRGPDSKGVIDFITDLQKTGYQIHLIRGNHEQMMLDAREDDMMWQLWLRNGGDTTLKSFGVTALDQIDSTYFTFLKETKFFIKTDKYLFVHAGLNFSKKNYYEDTDSMLWMRDMNRLQPLLGDCLLFHGHTPRAFEYIVSQEGNCFNIDGGCVYKQVRGLGKLVAVNLEEMKFVVVENCE